MKFQKHNVKIAALFISMMMILEFCMCPFASAAMAVRADVPGVIKETIGTEMIFEPVIAIEISEIEYSEPEIVEGFRFSESEIDLIALLTMAEVEGESEYAKRLVIDSVLNRVDHPNFPSSVHEVIYQKNQYTAMNPARLKRCCVREDIKELVKDELKNRTNNEVLFFRTEHYHHFGTPLEKVDHCYFSTY